MSEVQKIAAHIPMSFELIQDAPGSLTDIMRDILNGKRQPAPPPPEPDTPAGHLALLAATDGALRAVVELHAPQWHTWRWCCEGCDMDGYDVEAPEWPCRTVELAAQELGVDLGGEHG